MRKKFLSLFLAPALCLGLAVPALAADSNYFESNGISVSQTMPSTLPFT